MLINWNNLLIIRTLHFIFKEPYFFLNLDPGENYQFPTHLCYGLFVSQLGTQRFTKHKGTRKEKVNSFQISNKITRIQTPEEYWVFSWHWNH